MEPVIYAEDMAYGYTRPLARGVRLALHSGEVLAILGPNGAGKSTLLKTLAGILKPLEGKVLVKGMDTRTTPRRLLAHVAAYVPQAPQSRPLLTVLEYIVLGLKAPSSDPRVKAEHLAAAEEALSRLGIEGLADKGLWELSGGERQLVELARAIAPRPSVVLLDEPTSMLDARHASRVAEAILELAAEGTAVALVTHDPNLAIDVADNVLLVERGRVLRGSVEDLVTPEHLSRLYGSRLAEVEVDGVRRIVPAPLARRRRRAGRRAAVTPPQRRSRMNGRRAGDGVLQR